MEDCARQLAIGAMFAGCRLESVAGRGAMGIVYAARQLRPDRMVAVKVITPDSADDAEYRARFEREAALAASLDHQNVVPIHGVGEEDGLLYIIMRLVDGTDLGKLVRECGQLGPARVAHFVLQIAAALDAAHMRGLVHRDVKPGNVLVTGAEPHEHIYLTDFGLAKGIDDLSSRLSTTGNVVGTLAYISPEQASAEPVDGRADIYSLGCLLYKLLTGSVPFPRDSDVATIYAHLRDPPPVPSHMVRGLPSGLDRVIAQAMAKRPADRFSTAGALAAAVVSAVQNGEDRARVLRRSTALGAGSLTTLRRKPAFGPAPTELGNRGRGQPLTAAAHAAEDASVGLAEAPPRDEHVLLQPADDMVPVQPALVPLATPNRLRPAKRYALAAAASGTAALVVAGLVIESGRDPGPLHVGPFTARNGAFAVSYRQPWRAVALESAATLVLRPVTFTAASHPIVLSSGGTALAAGELARSARAPGGPPPQLVMRYGAPTAATGPVAGMPGQRYTWHLKAGGQVVAFILPTVSADLAILCGAVTSDAAGLRTCASLAASATAPGAQLLLPAQQASLTRTLTTDLSPAAVARKNTGGLALSRLRARASPARSIAAAEEHALRALARVNVPPRDREVVAALRASLRLESIGFGALGSAAAKTNRAAYSEARQHLLAAGRRLVDAVRAATSHGLGIPRFGPLALASLPPTPEPASLAQPAYSTAPSVQSALPSPRPAAPAPAPSHASPGLSVVPSGPVYSS